MLAIALRSTLASFAIAGFSLVWAADEPTSPTVDPESGLKIDANESWKLVKAHCASCHSGRLLAQHSLSRENWLKSIRRMQSDEGLWELGDVEAPILDYLSDSYGTSEDKPMGRVRRPLLNQSPIESDSDREQMETTDSDIENELETKEANTPSPPSEGS